MTQLWKITKLNIGRSPRAKGKVNIIYRFITLFRLNLKFPKELVDLWNVANSLEKSNISTIKKNHCNS